MRGALRAIALLLCASPARADDCVRIDAAALDPGLRDALVSQLRAALSRRSLDRCDESIATIVLATSDESAVRIAIVVRDAITNKTIERTAKLGDIPRDARAFALAQMSDELLRASWAELAVEDAPPPVVVVPGPVREQIPVAKPATTRLGIDVAIAIDHFTESYDQIGVDGMLHVWFLPRLGLVVRGGPRFALAQTTSAGPLVGNGALTSIGPAFTLGRWSRFTLGIEAEIGMLYARLESHTRSADGIAAIIVGTAQASFRVAPHVHVGVSIGGGGALRGVRVTDGTRDLAGPAGGLFTVRSGIGGDL
jgi:hypothetical protein